MCIMRFECLNFILLLFYGRSLHLICMLVHTSVSDIILLTVKAVKVVFVFADGEVFRWHSDASNLQHRIHVFCDFVSVST